MDDDKHGQEPDEHSDRKRGTPRPRGEGVRIIGAEEAAAAVEAGQVAGRRPEHEPRYGDVPAPPSGPRAPHRFPLPDSVDPAAVPHPPLASDPSPGRGQRVEGAARVQPFGRPGPGADTPGAGANRAGMGRSVTGPGDDSPDLGAQADTPQAGTRSSGGVQPSETAHWTDPSTGEPPRMIADEPADAADDLVAWTSLVGRQPSWQDRHSDWEEGGYQPAVPADDQAEPSALDPPATNPTRLFDEQAPGRLGRPPAEPGRLGRPPAEPGRLGRPPAEPEAPDYGPPPTRRIRIARQYPATPPQSAAPQSAAPQSPAPSPQSPAAPPQSPAAPSQSPAAPPQSPAAPPLHVPGRRPKDMGVRVATGLGILILTLALFKIGPLPSFILALVVVVLAAAEGFAVLHRAGYRPATLLGLTATASLMIASYLKGETAVPLIFALMVGFSLLWYLAGVTRARPTVNVAITWLGFLWVGFLGSFAALLLNPRIFPNRHGVAFLLGALLATVGHDVGGWLIGSRFGRHPLAPTISPNKTWEGLIGGMASAILVSVIITSHIHPWTLARAGALGVVVAVVAPLGDLCESMIKRDIGIKDMGSLLPGHGGMLDRIDALLFVLPATYYLVSALKLG